MRFCAFHEYSGVAAGIAFGERVVGLDDLNDAMGADYGPDLDAILRRGQQDQLAKSVDSKRIPSSGWRAGNLRFAPPLQRPSKIWGIGLNFDAHARELAGAQDDEPMAWMRPATTLAGDGANVALPAGIGMVSAEAEIGVVLGRHARDLKTREDAKNAVFGFAPVLDLTAEDLLRRNVRNLTRAKSYDGFCVVGPFVTTKDEWEPTRETRIVTDVDGQLREGTVAQMRHDPYELVRFFSHVFAWEPGDLLLTGTPGALPLKPGSTMRARIEGLAELKAKAV